MPIGYNLDQDIVNTGDTAELHASIATDDGDLLAASDISDVAFTIQSPDGNEQTIAGSVISDNEGAHGFARWFDTEESGPYVVVATFTLASGQIKSTKLDFEVRDPFAVSTLPTDQVTDQVWLRIEDLFDSMDGGPWMRDQTLRFFDKAKIANFVPDAILHVNLQPPMTQATIADFTTAEPTGDPDHDRPILTQAVLVVVIRHLIRSYVEQPDPQGGQVNWISRRDYQQRWMAVLQIEEKVLHDWLALWKRQFLGLGHSKLLVASKAGRMYLPGQRVRTVGRGWV